MTEEIKNKYIAAGIDLDSALDRFEGDEELFEHFAAKFLTDKNYEILVNSVEKSDYEEMFRSVHTLKGIAAQIGLTALYEECDRMCTLYRAEKKEESRSNFDKVKSQYEKAYSGLNK